MCQTQNGQDDRLQGRTDLYPSQRDLMDILFQLFDNSEALVQELEPCQNMTQFYSLMQNWNLLFFEDNENIVK